MRTRFQSLGCVRSEIQRPSRAGVHLAIGLERTQARRRRRRPWTASPWHTPGRSWQLLQPPSAAQGDAQILRWGYRRIRGWTEAVGPASRAQPRSALPKFLGIDGRRRILLLVYRPKINLQLNAATGILGSFHGVEGVSANQEQVANLPLLDVGQRDFVSTGS